MPAKAADARAPSVRGLQGPVGAGLIAIALLVILVASSIGAAGTFTVSGEQVLVGTTDGIAGVQAEDALRETMREADIAPDPLAYPLFQNLSKGVQVAGTFPGDVQSSDGVYVHYREATTSPVVLQYNPAMTDPSCTWATCDNGRLSDNAYATSAAGGDVATFTNFSFSVPSSAAITRVEVGYEAFDATGNDRLGIAISWDGGVSWCPTVTTGALPGADPNAYTYASFTTCTGHTWAPSDFGGLIATRITHSAVGPAETIDLDANVVRVTYQPLAYELALEYDWTGVASGQRHDLRIKGHISDENVTVQVLAPPSTWTPRLTLTNTTDQVLTYSLAPSEFSVGNVSIRFIDALGPDPVPSDLWLDYVDILTVVVAYHLDVVQTIAGVTGPNPTLDIEGNISVGSEDFDVYVWNFSGAAWARRMAAPFTSANAMHSVSLLAAEVGNGTVRIDFRDVDPASVIQAVLTLDLVRVSTTDVASGLSSIVLVGGTIAGIAAVALFLFFVILPRRRSASETPSVPSAPKALEGPKGGPPSPPPSPVAKGDASSPSPEIAVADLHPGGAYLVDEQEPAAAIRTLERLTHMGRSGFLLTRRNPLAVQRIFKLRHTKTVWLGEPRGSESGLVLAISLNVISTHVNEFLRTNPVGVVLIDGMKELVEGNDFPSVLAFIRETVKTVASGQQILLVSMPPGVVRGKELKQVAQSLDIVRVK